MIRELGSLCLAPVVMVGYLYASDILTVKSHRTTATDGSVISIQTCERGFGLDVKATSTGYYGAGLQYGLTFEPVKDFTFSIIPKFGISYVDHPVLELPQRTQFGVGGQMMLGYQRVRVGAELWHLSNGKALGLNVVEGPNIGVNLFLIQAGWAFY